ncbi:MAG: hypothetical protein KDB52_12415 [Solirubrobacterales bacterium]|nr:hypothetical protein [Solirubrobacterales bacterium]
MPDKPPDNQTPESESDGRIPRLAIWVVILGIVASLAIYGLSFIPGNGSLEIDWDTSEEIATPDSTDLGGGSFSLARTSLSAIAPNEDGLLLFRVAGAVRVQSGGRVPTRVRCDIFSRVKGDTRLARASRLRAAWPRSSDNLQAQDVPETSSVKYRSGDSKKIDLPIRDVLRMYTDTDVPTEVLWDGYVEDSHAWIWKMNDGTGAGTATLPWAVIFESETRPKGTIECSASVGTDKTDVKVPYLQEEWPITDDEPNTDSSTDDTGDVSNVE